MIKTRKKPRFEPVFKLCLFFMLMLLTGVFAGALSANFLPTENAVEMALPLSNGEFGGSSGAVFSAAFLQYVKPVLIMWTFAFFKTSLYCNMITAAYEGWVLGFTLGVFLKACGVYKGILLAITGVLPQYFVYIPALVYTCMATLDFSINRRKKQKSKINYLLKFGACIAGCLISALSDTYVTSLLLRLCMNGE